MSVELRQTALARGDRRSSLVFYRIVRRAVRTILHPWLRVQAVNTEVLDRPGPTILAPVHRSHLDSALVATQSKRRIRALGKESLFTTPGVSWVCAALGAIPVRRGQADRDALAAARMLLDRGESMIVFPEGGRRSGSEVTELFDGAAWLSARTGAPVVPIGISGTEAALPEGARSLHRSRVGIVVGEPLAAPVGPEGKRASRADLKRFTEQLTDELQRLQHEAEALTIE
ncbi:MAG: lysophospholipid acyltransferase family protein [Actinomycetota bacterium]